MTQVLTAARIYYANQMSPPLGTLFLKLFAKRQKIETQNITPLTGCFAAFSYHVLR